MTLPLVLNIFDMDKPKLTGSSRFKQGIFKPKHPEKYMGDPSEILYRSGLEMRFMKWLDTHPAILKWGSEEITIPYKNPLDGKMHRYFPDFVLVLKDRDENIKKMMVEIKPKKETMKPVKGNKKRGTYLTEATTYMINKTKWNAAAEHCKKHDVIFAVWTEEVLKWL